ncbi:helix-turn-helix domain-containing protein [Chloroflexota bacterium]
MNTQLDITKAELARRLEVSRTYVTLLTQGKKKPSGEMVDRLAELGLTANLSEFANTSMGTHNGPLYHLTEHTTFNRGVTNSRLTQTTIEYLLAQFLKSRRQGISTRTCEFYKVLLLPFVHSCELTPESINTFLSRLPCAIGNDAYYRAIRAFCN